MHQSRCRLKVLAKSILLYNNFMDKSRQIVKKCKEALAEQYGRRLKGVILYGSIARKESSLASDIDLLVLLDGPLDYFAELRNLIDALYPIQLESEKLISAKPVFYQDFEKGTLSLYRNARREGVAV
jgi:predicted nucleotidyltransferase